MIHNFKAFVTGSCAYGEPSSKSDIGLVIFVSDRDLDRLLAFCPASSLEEYSPEQGVSLRFEKLNLLCCTNVTAYEAWKQGTKELKKKSPVTRHFAIKFMNKIRAKLGMFLKKEDVDD